MGGEQFSELRALVGANMLRQTSSGNIPKLIFLDPFTYWNGAKCTGNYLRLSHPWRVASYDPMLS